MAQREVARAEAQVGLRVMRQVNHRIGKGRCVEDGAGCGDPGVLRLG